MSEVKVNKLSPRSGTTVTLGDSGDTISIPSGVTFDASSGGLAGTLTTAAQPNITSVGTLTTFRSTGIDDNATGTAITIDSSENVGIGGVPATVNQRLFIEGSNSALIMAEIKNIGGPVGLQLTANNGTDAKITFGDLADNGRGRIIYSNTDESMRFDVNNLSEAMRITSSGNVGIGTSSPSATLHIAGNSSPTTEFKVGNSSWNQSNSNAGLLHRYASSTGYSQLQINNVATSPSDTFTIRNSTGVAINLYNDGTSTFNGKLTVNDTIDANNITNRTSIAGVDPTPSDSNDFELGAGYLNLSRDDTAEVNQIQFGKNGTLAAAFSTGANYLAIKTNGDNERMRIDSSGGVGIGKSSVISGYNLSLGKSTNVSGEFTGITFQESTSNFYGYVRAEDNATPDTSFVIGHTTRGIVFKPGDTERMRIDTSGNIIINGTSAYALNALTIQEDSGLSPQLIFKTDYGSTKGHMYFLNNTTTVGSITSNTSSTSYNTSSDYRLKENVSYDFDATTRLKQLKPARFNFISDADTTVDGFIAHEVSSVVPEAVTGTHNEVKTWKEYEELPEGVSVGDNKLDENGNTIPEYQGIDQSKLVPLLVKTIQELEARITTLENA